MVRDLAVPEDVWIAISAYPQVLQVWKDTTLDHKETWLRYIDEAQTPGHRMRRIDIMIAGLKP